MKSRLLAVPVWCLWLLVALGTSLSSFGVGVEQPPEVKAFVINGGDPQRSMVTTIAITFSADVGASLQVDDLRLTNLTNNSVVTGAQFVYKVATKTGTWTFPTQLGKSLPDGNYLAVIRPADVVGPTGLQLVPNPGVTTWSTKFHRYFGDFDGDRDVDFLDTAKMRKADLTAPPNKNYNPAADYNGDGKIDDTDLAAFKARYLTVLSGQTFAPTVVGAPVRTSQQTVTLSGTAPPNTHVIITNGFFTFEGQSDENGKFSITVSLLANRINSLFVGGDGFTATDFSALTPVTIVQDSTPPFLYVDSPADQSTVDTATVTVTGRVGDLLSGFEGLTVKVNQVDANISAGIGPNGTFEARDIPLAMGENFLAIIATDSLGTSITKSVMVTRVAQLQMEVVSGNDQSALRNTELPAALVVRVRDTKGQPFANKIVNFQVTRSDGHASPAQGQTDPAGPMMAQVRTDAQGIASGYWRLGSDSGHSNNLLVASSAGVPGEARFRASADPRPPTQINVGMGNNQIGEAGGSAPLPLTAWASDNLNGAPNVPVIFKVTSGDAQVAAKDQPNAAGTVTIQTDSTGHVDAYLHFGPLGGPVTVEASFAGLQSNPAVFMARALVRHPGQAATFNAVVQDNTGLAIGGATCTLNINGIKLPPVITNANGFFTIADVNPGAGFVQVDGRTANKLGGQPFNQPGRFPSLVYRITIVPNADNPLPTTVYLPTLNPVNERSYDGTSDVDLTIQGIAGLKMTIKAGSMTLADGTRPTAAAPVTVSLNQVHADNIPMPIQDGVAPLLTWTLQPPGAHFDPPVAIQYPNMTGLRPGATTNFLSYNHDVERFEIVASGTVSADGSVIRTDPGVGLLNSGWGCNCPPYASTGACKGDEECTTTCEDVGMLTGGKVEADKDAVGIGETLTFIASGVMDSGGKQKKVCKKAGTSMIDIPADTPTFAWEIARDGTKVSSGTGSTATVTPKAPGFYVCTFTASVSRDCAPPDYTLPASKKVPCVLVTVTPASLTAVESTDSGDFEVKVEPAGLKPTYKWLTGSANGAWPAGAGNSPSLDYGSPTAAKTNVQKTRWYASPNKRRQAEAGTTATYTINCEVTVNGLPFKDSAAASLDVTVNFTGQTTRPQFQSWSSVVVSTRVNKGGVKEWYVSGRGGFSRAAPVATVNVPSTSQFYGKAFVHENKHVHQWTMEAPWKDLFNANALYASSLATLVSTVSEADLRSQIFAAVQTQAISDGVIADATKCDREQGAFDAMNLVAPHYLELDDADWHPLYGCP